jgi:hypothetical protein
LKSRINGDPNYQDISLIASFDISVTDIHKVIPFGQLMLYYVTPGTIKVDELIFRSFPQAIILDWCRAINYMKSLQWSSIELDTHCS